MRFNLKINLFNLFSFFLLFSFIGMLPVKSAFADTFTLSGSVMTSTGSAVTGATINVDTVNTTTVVASTTSDSAGNYNIRLVLK